MSKDTKKLYEIKELLSINGGPLPISRAGLYAAATKNLIPVVKIGRRLFVPSWYIDQLLMPPTGEQGA